MQIRSTGKGDRKENPPEQEPRARKPEAHIPLSRTSMLAVDTSIPRQISVHGVYTLHVASEDSKHSLPMVSTRVWPALARIQCWSSLCLEQLGLRRLCVDLRCFTNHDGYTSPETM